MVYAGVAPHQGERPDRYGDQAEIAGVVGLKQILRRPWNKYLQRGAGVDQSTLSGGFELSRNSTVVKASTVSPIFSRSCIMNLPGSKR